MFIVKCLSILNKAKSVIYIDGFFQVTAERHKALEKINYLKSPVKDTSFLFFTDESEEAASGTKRTDLGARFAMSKKRTSKPWRQGSSLPY
jgi:DNA integrity scanning protein DisA with diadenylate cyclase activity